MFHSIMLTAFAHAKNQAWSPVATRFNDPLLNKCSPALALVIVVFGLPFACFFLFSSRRISQLPVAPYVTSMSVAWVAHPPLALEDAN